MHFQIAILDSKEAQLNEVSGEYFKLKLEAHNDGNSLFESQRSVNIVLYHNNIPLQSLDAIEIQKDQVWDKEFGFEGKNEIVVIIEDASTKEKLDQLTVKKSSARDLGGLF